jgi:hypothetical protein
MGVVPAPAATAGGQAYTLQQYAAQFDAKFPGRGAGNAFLAYAAANPSLTPKQASSAFAVMIAVEGLDKAITAALGGSAGLLGAATKVQGLNPFQGWLTGFLSTLTSAHTWERVAQAVIGLGLIIVGLAKLASGTAAGKAAVKAGKAVKIL